MSDPNLSDIKKVWDKFEQQLEYIRIDEKDRRILQQISTQLKPKLPAIIDRFYNCLKTFPFTKSFLVSPEQIEQLKSIQLHYLKEMLEGVFDSDYIAVRSKIGDAHVNIGLAPKWYIGAYSFYCESFLPLLHDLYKDDPQTLQDAELALLKAFLLDIQVAIESYIDRYAKELIQTRTALEKKLWLEDRLLTFILSESTDAIVGFDEQDRISTWSQGAQKIFGYRTVDILDKSLSDLVVNKETIELLLRNADKNGYATLKGAYWKNQEGGLIEADATLTYLYDRHGSHIGSTLLIQDLTEMRSLAEQVKNMEQLTAMTKITASVAHEIRTPMGVIALTADLLQNRISTLLDRSGDLINDNEKQDVYELIADMQLEVDRLNEIVDHYLVLSRLKRPKKVSVELQPFFSQVVEELKEKSKSTIQFSLEVEDSIFADIDVDQFRRIFHNLFDNSQFAIHGPGHIHIEASLLQEEPDRPQGQIQIVFRDNGKGIPEDKLEGIFSAFVTHRTGGTGLGLYLVREIVEAHEGSVRIESQVGQGTSIFMTLPGTQTKVKHHAAS